jgi:ABC-2 type transport system ATP-binding protein
MATQTNTQPPVVKEGWKFEELHTEQGRLDEVFRSITLPDTVKEEKS